MTHSLTAPAARLQIIHGKIQDTNCLNRHATRAHTRAKRERTREQNASTHASKNASGTLATREPIDTAKTPFFPSLID